MLIRRIDPAPFSPDIGTTENLVLHATRGDKVLTPGKGLAGLIQLTLDGGAGNHTNTGGDGNDVLLGGDANDLVLGAATPTSASTSTSVPPAGTWRLP